ncbi:MAG: hypothetical protein M1839_007919 [Geoglossum umbratile]|nr:MAG: hypothetical protein M1839_007919 [Geoglossum umbratile]
MAPKNMKAIPLKWIQQNVLALLPEEVILSHEVLENLRDYTTKIEEAESTLPAGAVEFKDVLKMFGLKEAGPGMRWSLQNYELYDPPAALSVIQKEADFVMEGSPENEAYTRCRLNNILVCCIAEEKRLTMSKNIPPAAASADIPPTATSADPALRPTTPPSGPVQITLQFETELKYPVKYKNQTRMLSGIADYTVWYDSAECVGTNLIIVEAKRRRLTGEAAGQVLAYMGVVHRTWLQEGRRNAVVYGISTDGDEFRFWRIDNDSTVSQSQLYEWSQGQESEITSYIRYIIRAAIVSSPRTSPEKDQSTREASLSAFQDASKKKSSDPGLGELTLEEDEDMDVELVVPPSARPY